MNTNRGTEFEGSTDPNYESLKKDHLLIIAINNYKNGFSPLKNAVSDATAFKEVVTSKYGVQQVYELINETATRKNIFIKFNELRNSLTDQDNLIIYFSGHGELVNNSGYWIPVDGVANQDYTFLSNHVVKDLLKDIKAHHAVVIVDACFSGSLLLRTRSHAKERYYNMPSRWILTSGQLEPVPDGIEGFHSPFAQSLITQLKRSHKPYFSLRQLWLHMREGAIANSGGTPACEPIKDTNHQGGEFFFINSGKPPSSINELISPGVPNEIYGNKPKEKELKKSTIKIDPIPDPPPKPQNMDLTTLKKDLRQLQISSELKQAYELLIEHLKEDSSHTSIVYVRLGGLNQLEKNIAKGITANVKQQKAEISSALDYIISNLRTSDIK